MNSTLMIKMFTMLILKKKIEIVETSFVSNLESYFTELNKELEDIRNDANNLIFSDELKMRLINFSADTFWYQNGY